MFTTFSLIYLSEPHNLHIRLAQLESARKRSRPNYSRICQGKRDSATNCGNRDSQTAYVYVNWFDGNGERQTRRRCGQRRDKEGATSSRPGWMKTTGSLSPLRPIRSVHVPCRAVGGRRYSHRAVFPINNLPARLSIASLDDRFSTILSIATGLESYANRPNNTHFVTILRSVCALMRTTTWIFSLIRRVLWTFAEPFPIRLRLTATEWTNWAPDVFDWSRVLGWLDR